MTGHRKALQCFHQRLAGESLSNLAGVAGHWMPAELRTRLRRSGERKRAFAPMATFWNFLDQVLSPAQPCRETVRQIQAARHRRHKSAISPATGAYCQARARLPEALLQETWKIIAGQLTRATTSAMLWRGLRVGVVDGTTLSMPDTAANQAVWPQPSSQKPGCGFPILKLVGLFSLSTGAICALSHGTLHNAEQTLFLQLWSGLAHGFDLLLGDRHFGSFANFCALCVFRRKWTLDSAPKWTQCRSVATLVV